MTEALRPSPQHEFPYLAPEGTGGFLPAQEISDNITAILERQGLLNGEYSHGVVLDRLLTWAQNKRDDYNLRLKEGNYVKGTWDQTADFIANYTGLFVDMVASAEHTADMSTPEEKFGQIFIDLEGARLNQKLVAEMQLLSKLPDGDKYKEQARRFISVIHNLWQERIPIGEKLEKKLNGVRAHVAATNLLEANDHHIVSLDPNSDAEIIRWELRGGVDLATISPKGNLYLIDIKSAIRGRTSAYERIGISPQEMKANHYTIADDVDKKLYEQTQLIQSEQAKQGVEQFKSAAILGIPTPRVIQLFLPYTKEQVDEFGTILDINLAEGLRDRLP